MTPHRDFRAGVNPLQKLWTNIFKETGSPQRLTTASAHLAPGLLVKVANSV